MHGFNMAVGKHKVGEARFLPTARVNERGVFAAPSVAFRAATAPRRALDTICIVHLFHPVLEELHGIIRVIRHSQVSTGAVCATWVRGSTGTYEIGPGVLPSPRCVPLYPLGDPYKLCRYVESGIAFRGDIRHIPLLINSIKESVGGIAENATTRVIRAVEDAAHILE